MYGCRGNIGEALNINVSGNNGSQSLVLGHGFGSDQSVWHFVIPYLACYFRVVVFDMVFSGNVDSGRLYDDAKYGSFDGYASDLECVLDYLDVREAVYLGHSMAAMIGCVAATRRPDLFRHLILLNGSPRYLNSEGYQGGFERPQVDDIFKQMAQNFSNWVTHFAPFAVKMKDSNAVSEFEHSLGKMNPKIAQNVAKMIFLSDLRKLLPKVMVPTTIILTREDPIIPKSVAYFMKSRLQKGHAKVKILKSQGHFPQLTDHFHLLKALSHILF